MLCPHCEHVTPEYNCQHHSERHSADFTMKLSDFDYELPLEYIAQAPAEPRDSSRLMVVHRDTGEIEHRIFREIADYLKPNDVLVLNKTRVIPARLLANKTETGGKVEVLLLKKLDSTRWLAMVGGKRVTTGLELSFQNGAITLHGVVEEEREDTQRVINFHKPIDDTLDQLGEIPLPPYINNPDLDPERYQTVYSRVEGSAAAPTAGLHFTPDLLIDLQRSGIKLAYCTLHIGLDTFAPVRVEALEQHQIHREQASLGMDDAKLINEARLAGGRIIAVGTTSARTLETAAWRSIARGHSANDPTSITRTIQNMPDGLCPWQRVMTIEEETDLFIYPPYEFKGVDVMLTNFHLPKSTLLMMISAFANRDLIWQAYQTAIQERYRFYSLGDAMLLI